MRARLTAWLPPLCGEAVEVIEPIRAEPKTTMPRNLGEDMPQQPSLPNKPLASERDTLVVKPSAFVAPLTT